MASGNTNNLIMNYDRTPEERKEIATLGGIASGQARRKNAIIRNSLKQILNSGFKLPDSKDITDKDIKEFIDKCKSLGIDTNAMSLPDLMNCGQILSAIGGKAENYKLLLETIGELTEQPQEPHITSIEEVIDNSHLEKVLYEENKH